MSKLLNHSKNDEITKNISCLRKKVYGLERDINDKIRIRDSLVVRIKNSVKSNEPEVAKLHARQLLKTKRMIDHLCSAKARVIIAQSKVERQLFMANLAGIFKEVNSALNNVSQHVKVSEAQNSLDSLTKESYKMDALSEVFEELRDSLVDDTELNDDEVNDVIASIIGDKQQVTKVDLPAVPISVATEDIVNDIDEQDIDVRLAALRN